MAFVEKYLNQLLDTQGGVATNQNPTIAYDVLRYMVCEIQYGGRITDNLDRELFSAYGDKFLREQLTGPDFTLAELSSSSRDGRNRIKYIIPNG